VPDLRRTPAGKLQRGELAKLLAPHLRAGFSPPRDPSEELVAGFFAEVLGIDGIGAFDNFFELGGDSLRGTQFVIRVNSALGSNLEVANLFKRPTVAEFAAELTAVNGAGRQSSLPPIEPLPRSIFRADAAGAKPVT
jgi:acyl carrier protein